MLHLGRVSDFWLGVHSSLLEATCLSNISLKRFWMRFKMGRLFPGRRYFEQHFNKKLPVGTCKNDRCLGEMLFQERFKRVTIVFLNLNFKHFFTKERYSFLLHFQFLSILDVNWKKCLLFQINLCCFVFLILHNTTLLFSDQVPNCCESCEWKRRHACCIGVPPWRDRVLSCHHRYHYHPAQEACSISGQIRRSQYTWLWS